MPQELIVVEQTTRSGRGGVLVTERAGTIQVGLRGLGISFRFCLGFFSRLSLRLSGRQ